jgi:hypothetical protein
MATFLKDVHDLVNFLAGKNIATKQPPERIDLVVYQVITEVFNTYYDNYVKTQKIDDYLMPYRRKQSIVVTNNIGLVAAEYAHARNVETSTGVHVDLVPDKFWDGRKNSKVAPPTTTNYIARIEPSEGDPAQKVIEVYPSTNVVLRYFKQPNKPVYAYTKEGDRYIYDEANTVDIELPRGVWPDITTRVLAGLGINIRDRDLNMYSQQARLTEQVK